MKKFGTIISFSIIVVIFIGLNYLLWERESREKDIKNLQNSSASDTLTINALNRQMENMENTLKTRDDSINKITEENDKLRKNLEELKQENIRFDNIIKSKTEAINNLYNNLGTQDYIKNLITQWAQYINQKDYEKAYSLWYGEKKEEAETLEEYIKKYKNIVNSINVKSMEIYNLDLIKKANEDNIDKKIIDEYEKGDIFLMVELDVKLEDWAVKYDIMFDQGINKNVFLIKYDSKYGKWYIIDIRKTM